MATTAAGATPARGATQLEFHSIEPIPQSERHGKPWNLFTLWFAANVTVNAVVTGALSVYVGLNLEWAIIAILIGNFVGALFMAYHSAQGPVMGLPQMIQSRAQFGFYGAILPMIVTVLMYLGFGIEGGVVAGQAISAETGMPTWAGIVIFNLALLVIALVGYKLIHNVSKILTVVSGITFLALFIEMVVSLPSASHGPKVTWSAVLLAVSIFVAWQITWAPYVSDYSRYLPTTTPLRKTFWYTYIGSAFGASGPMMIGAFAVLEGGDAFSANSVGYLAGRFTHIYGLLFAIILISIIPAGAEGAYGAFLTSLSAFSQKGLTRASTPLVRAAAVTVFLAIATILAVITSAHLLATFENITLFLLYLLVPWTAINLTDFYLVRHGRYHIDELCKRDGIYGLVKWRIVLLYLITIGIEVPFVNATGIYEGPVAQALNGADIAWIIGLAIPAIGYWLLTRPEVAHDRALAADLDTPATHTP